ncbi:MAG: hypothetical protein P4L42_13835 [Desulfocapsaceae bacterium]|nr:hypothetical protein [Desulfocapsaceae bacterium]
MVSTNYRNILSGALVFFIGIVLTLPAQILHAKDTDIYAVSTKNNAYILLDNSGSMAYGVYEDSVDYDAMYNYYMGLGTIYDPASATHEDYKKDTIYLLLGQGIGVSIFTAHGKTYAFTGDTGSNGTWTNPIDTHTTIDPYGNLVSDGSGTARLSVDGNGYVLFDGKALPPTQNILLHNTQGGTDIGFAGLMSAPGNYFSGYKTVTQTAGSAVTAANGTQNIYFFVKGNWANLQNVFNLTYSSGAHSGLYAWQYEPYYVFQTNTQTISISYPTSNTTQYPTGTIKTNSWSQPAANNGSIQVHFSFFDINPTLTCTKYNKSGTTCRAWSAGDSVQVCDGSNNNCTSYNNANMPTNANNVPTNGWSAWIPGNTVNLNFSSDSYPTLGKGYAVDQVKYTTTSASSGYLIQTRMQVAQLALTSAISSVYNKMYWGLATFNYDNYGNGTGAKFLQYINTTSPATLSALQNSINSLQPLYGTPLGEALQDIFVNGYYNPVKNKTIVNQSCTQNFVVVVTDGFPSTDDTWTKISGVDFSKTNDGDGWTEDPSQYTTPPLNYYDSVAGYLYNHSIYDQSQIPAANLTACNQNIITNQIAFGVVHPLLQDAALDGGGSYSTVFNTAQAVAALESGLLKLTNAVSYTAPVASVDATNKIQNGNDLYFGLFLPEASGTWYGNLKKFTLGDASKGQDPMMVYGGGANPQPALDSNGNFLSTVTDIWTGKTGSFAVTENGAGALLLTQVNNDFNSGSSANPAPFWSRNIFTLINNGNGTYATPQLNQSINPTALGLVSTDTSTRNKIVNYTYGYTYDANADGTPVTVRPWVLGSIIHSKPVVVDYYDPNNISTLLKRYIVVGANDGMLHVFDDSPTGTNQGQEVYAFIPQDLLPKLQAVATGGLVDMVDGPVTLYRNNNEPKYLIFGERRGGGSYWCLNVLNSDPSKWTVQWQYSNPAIISQSWAEPQIASVPYDVDSATGMPKFQDALIFTGGYDPLEDNYPEPFTDNYKTGNPYNTTPIASLTLTNGHYPAPVTPSGATTPTWDPTAKNNGILTQDTNANGYYDPFNPTMDSYGQGIFVVDIDNPAKIITPTSSGKQILPFQVTYSSSGTSTNTSTGNPQTRTDMKFSFPASPAVVVGAYNYYYKDASGNVQSGTNVNTLKAIYGIDIYANLFKVSYDFEDVITKPSSNPNSWTWSVANNNWSTTKIFSANPGSTNPSGAYGQNGNTYGNASNLTKYNNNADQGRKAFYPPAISWGGSGSYFDQNNYSYPNTTFSGTSEIAALLFGTGDREHPLNTMIRNRMYSVYDDSSVTATQTNLSGITTPIIVSTTGFNTKNGYEESDLFNLTCGELGTNSTVANKTPLSTYLTDDATITVNGVLQLENGNENDAKGWYIVLEEQGKCATASGIMNNIAGNLSSTDNHTGEAIDSQPVLYAGTVYFTSYQPTSNNACNPQGNGYAYSLDYATGSAAMDLSTANGTTIEITDRYMKYDNIYGIPSGFSIFTSGGTAGAMSMMGSTLVGPKGAGDFQIPSPGLGLELYYWRQGNSQKK